jgi:uncharacterized protein (TIGR02001 family)
MFKTRPALALSTAITATAITAAGPAFAQDFSVTAGLTLVTEYEASGLRQSDGPALQAYVQGDIGGFYIGAWASNVDFPGGNDRLEYNLYLGYANEIGNFSYDLGYAAYYYDRTGFCCSEVIFSGEVALGSAVSVGLRLASDPDGFDYVNTRLFGSYAISDAVTLDARYGSISGGGGYDYWSVGMSYAVADNASVFAAYHDTDVDSDFFLLGVSLDFAIR